MGVRDGIDVRVLRKMGHDLHGHDWRLLGQAYRAVLQLPERTRPGTTAFQACKREGESVKYNHDIHGIELKRDCYAEQHAEPRDVKFNYMVTVYGECIGEGEDPHLLGRALKNHAKRLATISRFLLSLKQPGRRRQLSNEGVE